MEIHRLKVCENKVLRRTFGPKKNEEREGEENCITRSFIICTLQQDKYYYTYLVEEDKNGRTYSTDVGKEECV
jgi:hypothetical protein